MIANNFVKEKSDYYTNHFLWYSIKRDHINDCPYQKTRILHSKSIIFLGVCLFLADNLYPSYLLVGLELNYPLNIRDTSSYIFSVYLNFPKYFTSIEMNLLFTLKYVTQLRIMSTISNIIHVRRLNTVIFSLYICTKHYDFLPIILYGAVLIRCTVMIEPTLKLII